MAVDSDMLVDRISDSQGACFLLLKRTLLGMRENIAKKKHEPLLVVAILGGYIRLKSWQFDK